jgi:hypothetical protein
LHSWRQSGYDELSSPVCLRVILTHTCNYVVSTRDRSIFCSDVHDKYHSRRQTYGREKTNRSNEQARSMALLLTPRPRSIIFRLVRDLTYSRLLRLRVPFRSLLNHSWHVRSAIGVDEPPKRSLSKSHGQDSNTGNTYVRVSSRLMLWVKLPSAPKLHRSSYLYFVLIKSDTPGRSHMAGLRINNTDAYY